MLNGVKSDGSSDKLSATDRQAIEIGDQSRGEQRGKELRDQEEPGGGGDVMGPVEHEDG